MHCASYQLLIKYESNRWLIVRMSPTTTYSDDRRTGGHQQLEQCFDIFHKQFYLYCVHVSFFHFRLPHAHLKMEYNNDRYLSNVTMLKLEMHTETSVIKVEYRHRFYFTKLGYIMHCRELWMYWYILQYPWINLVMLHDFMKS